MKANSSISRLAAVPVAAARVSWCAISPARKLNSHEYASRSAWLCTTSSGLPCTCIVRLMQTSSSATAASASRSCDTAITASPSSCCELAQQRVEVVLGRQVEADRRLVEHEQALARAERLREHHAALLAARELPDRALRAIRHADAPERVGDGAAVVGVRPPPGPEVRETSHHHDVAHARREARRRSRDAAARSRSGAPGRSRRRRPAQHLDAARRDRHETEQRAQQRRLARTVRTDHAEEAARVEREGDVLEHALAVALDAHVLAHDDAIGAHGAPLRARVAKARAFQRISSS